MKIIRFVTATVAVIVSLSYMTACADDAVEVKPAPVPVYSVQSPCPRC